MNMQQTYLIKLKFTTSIHIGSDNATPDISSSSNTMHADTFYSALIIESYKYGGVDKLEKINNIFKNGAKLSGLMPYKKDTYFVPKPIINIEAQRNSTLKNDSVDKKILKNLTHIDISKFDEYLNLISGEKSSYNPKNDADRLNAIGKEKTRTQLRIEDFQNGRQQRLDNPMPYYVGTFTFNDDSGLYFLLDIQEDYLGEIMKLVDSLGYTGIGGRVSSGLGKFIVEEVLPLKNSDKLKPFSDRLNLQKYNRFMTLSVCLPKDDELKRVHKSANYLLLKRSGFIQSYTYSDTLQKKKDKFAFSPGSVFAQKFEGDIYDVSVFGSHKVYRYLKPFFIGVI